ncbi:MAG: hypothetical protein PHY43_08315 [Verrucomicrobiales bacterium]|nr:hypothetical protein [Verrucomicrobiales bacterium]
MNNLHTYQDIAQRWKVSDGTVRRWVALLKKNSRFKPIQPTRSTIRFTKEQCDKLEISRTSQLLKLNRLPDAGYVQNPPKTPAKTDKEKINGVLTVRRKNVPKRPCKQTEGG